ncbi:hypothetical protein WDU94_006228 [Cyamophila willieti]
MEKLLDYERETFSLGAARTPSDPGLPSVKVIAAPGAPGAPQGAAPQGPPGTNNRFSNAARNVLTKIKCVPPSSVLSPDNRKWLESQGDKSPEIARRMILGQQSYVFGQDGDLIESPSSSCIGGDSGDRNSPRSLPTHTNPRTPISSPSHPHSLHNTHTHNSHRRSPSEQSSQNATTNSSTFTSSSMSSPNLNLRHHASPPHHSSTNLNNLGHSTHQKQYRPFSPSTTSNSTSNLTDSISSEFESPTGLGHSSDRFYKSVLQISHLNNIKFSHHTGESEVYDEDDVFTRESASSTALDERNNGIETPRYCGRNSENSASSRNNGIETPRYCVRIDGTSEPEINGNVYYRGAGKAESEMGGTPSEPSESENGGYILLNIDRRREEELSKSTETIVNQGESENGLGEKLDERGNDLERHHSENNFSQLENKNHISSSTNDIGNHQTNSSRVFRVINEAEDINGNRDRSEMLDSFDNRELECNQNDDFNQSGVRQRPSIVINHCESIDIGGNTKHEDGRDVNNMDEEVRIDEPQQVPEPTNTIPKEQNQVEISENEISKIDDNQNIVDKCVPDNKMVSGFSMANLVYNMIVDKEPTNGDNVDAVINRRTENQQEYVENNVGFRDYIGVKDRYCERYSDCGSYRAEPEDLMSTMEDTNLIDPSDIIVIDRNMKNIDDIDAQLFESKSRDLNRSSIGNIGKTVETSSLINEKINQNNETTENVYNNVENIANSQSETPVNSDAIKDVPSFSKMSFGGVSMANLVYNMIVDRSNESEKLEDGKDRENSERNTAENDTGVNCPTIVLNTLDNDNAKLESQDRTSSQLNDEKEIRNFENANEKSKHLCETSTENVNKIETDDVSNGNPNANRAESGEDSITSQTHLIVNSFPLIQQIKRTNSALSLREELLESLGSLEHERSPDLDDLLSSIGPIRVDNDDYSDVEGDDIYESDFDEDFRVCQPVCRHGKRMFHQSGCRKRHSIPDRETKSDDEANGNHEELCNVCECSNNKTRRNSRKTGKRNSTVSQEDSECEDSNREYKRNNTDGNSRLFAQEQNKNTHERTERSENASYENNQENPNTESMNESTCCRHCYRPDYDYTELMDQLDETCHIPVIKSIDKIISTLENVLEPLENALELRDGGLESREPQEQINDSATESEISCHYKRRDRSKRLTAGHVDNLNGLIAKMNHINDTQMPSLNAAEFNALSSHDQCSIQCKILRQALSTYLYQMSQQELHEELKQCLSGEVERVIELLNGNIDVGVLSRVVLQMTSLLHHQYELNEQIRDLTQPPPFSPSSSSPSNRCHSNHASRNHDNRAPCCLATESSYCHGDILKRVEALELQVRRNAKELEDMKRRLEEKML